MADVPYVLQRCVFLITTCFLTHLNAFSWGPLILSSDHYCEPAFRTCLYNLITTRNSFYNFFYCRKMLLITCLCFQSMVLHSQNRTKAVEILVKDLKVFSAFNEDLFKEITQLLTLDNFRHVLLSFIFNFILCIVYLASPPRSFWIICSGKMSNFPSMVTLNQPGISCFSSWRNWLKQTLSFGISLLSLSWNHRDWEHWLIKGAYPYHFLYLRNK